MYFDKIGNKKYLNNIKIIVKSSYSQEANHESFVAIPNLST